MIKEKKRNQIIKEIQEVLSRYNLTIEDALEIYGLLGYNIGASIAGYKKQGPTLEELKEQYYKTPTVDISLMLQGLTVTTWTEDWKKNPIISTHKEEQNK